VSEFEIPVNQNSLVTNVVKFIRLIHCY